MRLTLVGPVHAVGVIAHLLRAGVTPVPVLTPSERHVCGACHRRLVGAFNAPVQLVLSVTLEVVLRLRLRHPRRGLLLVHPVSRGRAHGRGVLGVPSPPPVVVAHAALVVVAHVWVRSSRRVGTGHAGAVYSSGAVHINLTVQILPLLRETHGGAVGVERIP